MMTPRVVSFWYQQLKGQEIDFCSGFVQYKMTIDIKHFMKRVKCIEKRAR